MKEGCKQRNSEWQLPRLDISHQLTITQCIMFSNWLRNEIITIKNSKTRSTIMDLSPPPHPHYNRDQILFCRWRKKTTMRNCSFKYQRICLIISQSLFKGACTTWASLLTTKMPSCQVNDKYCKLPTACLDFDHELIHKSQEVLFVWYMTRQSMRILSETGHTYLV